MSKKKIELRIDAGLKAKYADYCAANGRSMSEDITAHIKSVMTGGKDEPKVVMTESKPKREPKTLREARRMCHEGEISKGDLYAYEITLK